MKKFSLVGILCLLHLSLSAQEPVSVGNYRNFKSAILGGEVTYLGTLYQKAGETVRAKECYNQALRINPEFEAAKNALGQLK
ncbi:MAG TPA: tetratricopeptide repeat protein [Bacteroidales bacterium]|nr:tetratricopeptide repeat protein [Bacteroidales bacterium]HPS50307.1 tetratricopeptide repeat protein [Bacteroidales bacterium]